MFFQKKVINNLYFSQHSLFQQNKINAIIKFLSCYAKNEQLWKHIPYTNIIQNKYTPKEVDELIFPLMNDLQSSKNELALFLDENNLVLFEEITDSIMQLSDTLQKLYFSTNDKKDVSISNEFYFLQRKVFKENKNRILEVGKMSRKMFNS